MHINERERGISNEEKPGKAYGPAIFGLSARSTVL